LKVRTIPNNTEYHYEGVNKISLPPDTVQYARSRWIYFHGLNNFNEQNPPEFRYGDLLKK